MLDGVMIMSLFLELEPPEKTVERSDAAANRALLLDTAKRLFAEQGVAEVSLAEIIQAAGVGRGTLYRRFANKGELCLALLHSQFAAFQEKSVATIKEQTAAGVPWLQQLTLFLDGLIDFVERHTPLLSEIQREGVQSVGDGAAPYSWLHDVVVQLLQQACMTGELSDSWDIPVLADMLLAPLTAQYFRYQREVRKYTLQRMCAGLHAMIAHLGLQENSRVGT